jgi:HSP20 family protein
MFGPMSDPEPRDPWANFPGGNPFGPNGPFGGNPFGPGGPFAGRDPLGGLDEWVRGMGVDPAEFRRLFDEMQRDLQAALRNMGNDPSKGFVAGLNVRIGPDGKPHFSSFGNKPRITPNQGPGMPRVGIDEREPLTDVIDEGETIAITMELPGVDKSDINLNMTEEQLEVGVDTELRKYHKRVRLPGKVDPTTTKATFKNGILDVSVRRVESERGGVRIAVE